MKLHIRRFKLNEIVLLSLLGVLMYVSQIILASLPNIELVTLLIIVITRKFGIKALASVYVFVVCEILTFGLGFWAINYLYIWAILCIVVCLIRHIDSTIVYVLISAIFGLTFDIFCSIPYFVTGGLAFGISYIISGIGFSILHCIGNFILCLFLYKPLDKIINNALKTHKKG